MADLSGQTLGKYQLIERMGRGGMADVYKGYQPGLDRYVAVKVLHPHLSEDPDFITRFRREAKSVADLRHPHIVQVFDFDVQGENYYMVMEYVEGGKTLKELLQGLAARGERLPIEQTIDIVAKLADALAYAHGLGMVHRDIKPANVLIPNLDRPVLSDFGIARLLGETGLTSSGQLVGTPAYMSPEQGKGERGDARSDIYALGIVLYEMLTGRPPYDADTPYAVILKHINDPLVPPHVVIGPLPDAVERIVLKCLAKNPDDRFASMADLRGALRSPRPEGEVRAARVATGDVKDQATVSVSAPPTFAGKSQLGVPAPVITESAKALVGRPARLPKWAPIAAAAAVIFGVVAILAIASGSSTPQATTPQPTDNGTAVTEPTEPSAETSEAQALVDEGYQQLIGGDIGAALDLFNQALALEPDNPNALVGRAVAEASRYGDGQAVAADLDRAAQVIPDDPLLHYGRGLLYNRAEGYFDAEASEMEFTLAIESCGDLAALCSAAYFERSQVRVWNLGDVEGGLADVDSAIEVYPDESSIYYLYASRADIRYQAAGDAAGAMKDLETAYDLSQSGEYLERAAAIAVQVEDYESALNYYDQLLDEQAGDPRYLVRRGYVEWQAGEPEAAADSGARALELNPDLLEAHYLLGLILLDGGQPQEALAEFQIVSAETDPDLLYQATWPFFTTEFGHDIFYDMARAAHALGDIDAALGFIDQSLQRNDYWPYPYIERGQILFEQGDLAGARENYLKAREIASDDPELQASIDELLTGLSK